MAKMNKEMLEKEAKKLERLRHTEHFGMSIWARKTDYGTAACIAGDILISQGFKPIFEKDGGNMAWYFLSPQKERVEAEVTARRLLGLTKEQGKRLFYRLNWPEEFQRDGNGIEIYNNPKVAAARIRHFIATNGKE